MKIQETERQGKKKKKKSKCSEHANVMSLANPTSFVPNLFLGKDLGKTLPATVQTILSVKQHRRYHGEILISR